MTISLAEIARLNSGRGPVKTQQPGAPYAVATGNPNTTGAGVGVDVSAAHLALVIVRPADGDVSVRLWVRWSGEDEFDLVDGGRRDSLSENWSQRLQVVGADELFVEVVDLTATAVDVIIAPCTG